MQSYTQIRRLQASHKPWRVGKYSLVFQPVLVTSRRRDIYSYYMQLNRYCRWSMSNTATVNVLRFGSTIMTLWLPSLIAIAAGKAMRFRRCLLLDHRHIRVLLPLILIFPRILYFHGQKFQAASSCAVCVVCKLRSAMHIVTELQGSIDL